MKNQKTTNKIDWITIFIYFALITIGFFSIYSSQMNSSDDYILDFSQNYGKQLIFIVLSILLIIILLSIDAKIYERFSSVFYGISLLSLAGLFAIGKTIAGQRCWYAIGSFTIQPAEFAKVATALALAKFISDSKTNLKSIKDQIIALLIVALPILLILPQPDPGSALIFTMFIFVLYREGLTPAYIWIGFFAILLFVLTLKLEPLFIIGLVILVLIIQYFKSRKINRNIILSFIIFCISSIYILSVNYVFENVFKQHHRDRFNILLGEKVDLQGVGYNSNQSQIAIGSGGWLGKGYLEGTQTKGNFVPEQHTDYIFTTVGEEWGFIGSTLLIALFASLILRILYLSERQKTKFSRVYGYGVASVLFTHFFVNIAMVIGIFPTIGVPLPFLSYGGSSLWSFTILLFIFVKLDANKVNEW